MVDPSRNLSREGRVRRDLPLRGGHGKRLRDRTGRARPRLRVPSISGGSARSHPGALLSGAGLGIRVCGDAVQAWAEPIDSREGFAPDRHTTRLRTRAGRSALQAGSEARGSSRSVLDRRAASMDRGQYLASRTPSAWDRACFASRRLPACSSGSGDAGGARRSRASFPTRAARRGRRRRSDRRSGGPARDCA